MKLVDQFPADENGEVLRRMAESDVARVERSETRGVGSGVQVPLLTDRFGRYLWNRGCSCVGIPG